MILIYSTSLSPPLNRLVISRPLVTVFINRSAGESNINVALYPPSYPLYPAIKSGYFKRFIAFIASSISINKPPFKRAYANTLLLPSYKGIVIIFPYKIAEFLATFSASYY